MSKGIRIRQNNFAKVVLITCAIFTLSFFAWFNFAKPNTNFAYAAGGTPCTASDFVTLQSCINGTATNAETDIAVTTDITMTAGFSLPTNTTIVLDCGGNSLLRNTTDSLFYSLISANATLTISNCILDGQNLSTSAALIRMYSGTLNLENGATLQNGDNTGSGGAVMSTAPSVVNMSAGAIIQDNYSPSTGGINVYTLNMTGGEIINNSSTNEGGLYVQGAGSVQITGGTVSGNSATQTGGGIFIGSGATVDISGVTFANNTAGATGGAIYNLGGSLTIANSTFTNNLATAAAGAIGGGAIGMNGGSLNVTDGTFTSNTANPSNGGAINANLIASDISITDSTFQNNSSFRSGGAIFVGGTGTLTLDGDQFIGNSATTYGGGALVLSSIPTNIKSSVFRDNSAGTNGGAITMDGDAATNLADLANLTVDKNTTFSGNTAQSFSRMDRADQALYDAHIFATAFSLPAPFNGYNNYDIHYESDLTTDICPYNLSLWADEVNCVKPTEPETPTPPVTVVPEAPNTGVL